LVVARRNISIPKIPILVYFRGPWNGKCPYIYMCILRQFDMFVRSFGCPPTEWKSIGSELEWSFINYLTKTTIHFVLFHFASTTKINRFVHWIRDARWFVFKPKIPSWVNFRGSCNGKCWYILCPFSLFYGHWKYFMAMFCDHLVYFPPFWYVVPRKIWQLCIELPISCTQGSFVTKDIFLCSQKSIFQSY
jgi:hypothetical protein